MFIFFKKNIKYFYLAGLFIIIFFPASYIYATLSCSVTTSALCTDTVVLRMSGSSNAHAELPSQSTKAYSFDGINDYVHVALNHGIGTGDFTWSTWVYLNSKKTGTYRGFMAMNDYSPAFNYHVNGTHWGVYWDPTGPISTGRILSTGKWYHLSIVRSSGTLYFYENGVQVYSKTGVTQSMSDGTLRLGRRWYAELSDLDGLLDEVGFWGRALSADEISELYNGGSGLAYPLTANLISNLISYWELDESTGDAIDSHGSNNGVVTGATQGVTVRIDDSYNDNVVCCNGIIGLGNSCSGNYDVVTKLSSVMNAHVEEKTQTNYGKNACLSSSFVGDEITIAYQPTNCTGYDTTLFSMASTPTNSQVGTPVSYNNKVCAKILSQSLSFSISDNSIGFGNLSSSGLRYATGDGTGGSSEVEAFNFTVNTNAPSGYVVSMNGETLKNGAIQIDPIGGINSVPSPGTKSFGIRAVATGGSGVVSSPYDGVGFAYDAVSTFDSIASAPSGDGVTTTYSVRTVATIDELLDPGNYSTNLTYIITANF